jgi:hypothetical protein
MDIGDMILKVYLWNAGKERFRIRKISIEKRPGNQRRYDL